MRRKVNWQTGRTIISIDIKRLAGPPGWRRSRKSGKEYYEARANRTDISQKKKL